MAKIRKREEIKTEDTWALEDLYGGEELFEKDCIRLSELIDRFSVYQGRLKESSGMLFQALEAYAEMNQLFEKVYVYANQKLHQDMGNAKSQQTAGELEVMRNRLDTVQSYLVPEILELSGELLEKYYEELPKLTFYRRFLEEISRQKAHTLDAKTEGILAKAGEMANAPSNIFRMFQNADITFEPVTGEEGKKLPLTQGSYMSYLQSGNRRIRQEAFENLYQGYAQFKNTLAAVYEANAKQANFYARMHNYGSSLEAALDDANIPVEVYENLIEAVHAHMEPMHRYMRLRKKLLGVDELHMYDIYVPLVREMRMEIPYEKAKGMVKKGLAPLGAAYQELLQEGFDHRWIDVYENENKRTGAYSWGAYGTHPYVLLNYHERLNDVFTLAHEMGHALHSWHSDQKQEYLYAGYKIFVAEVASTCNEALLIHDLMENCSDEREKAYLINYFLEQFRTTLYRQTMFAEFEKITHEMTGRGASLNADTLCRIYLDLNRAYYGADVVSDEEIQYEWSRIPHFYTPFYVYQYATGFSAAIAISSKILAGEEKALEGYFQFLSGGSSQDPIELLKLAGVDMEKREPVERALHVFEEYVEKFEKLCCPAKC